MSWLDYPPVWLIAALGLAWAQAELVPLGPGWGWTHGVGGAVALLGAGLMLAALVPFLRAGTTVVPHRQPSALVVSGVFRISRNPIYLGDVLILAGLSLRWEAWLGLVLLPGFVWVLRRRFIEPEEARLRAAFGAEYVAWAARVRRWV